MSASNFKGYLIKNAETGSTYNGFMLKESYSCTPNQREELVAYRDDNTRNLTRVTASGKKTTMTFSTVDLDLTKMEAMIKFFESSMTNKEQRKCHITFWDFEKFEYRTSYFYIPNWTFNVNRITSDNIYFKDMEITLTEY